MAESAVAAQADETDASEATTAAMEPAAVGPATVGPAEIIEPDLDFIRELLANGGDSLKKCYQCATCSVTCELSPAEAAFPRKEMHWAQWGLKERLLADPDVFLCYQCNDCTKTCPRGARPGDVLAAIRAAVYRRFAVPSFMGGALGNPKAMLPLFLVPVLVLFGLLFEQQSRGEGFAYNLSHLFSAHEVVYHHFLRHGILEMLFMFGNLVIFALAAAGFYRFYNNLRKHHKGGVSLTFLQATVATVKEILIHRRFNQCGQNKPRSLAHMMVLFGFFGAAATAGLAVGYMLYWMKVLHPGQPFDGLGLDNPIKWLGVLSGVAMVVGSGMMIQRRRANTDDVGANGFVDQLFLWMILLIASTGMATWLLRLAGNPAIAYPVYFIHLVIVFFLLWYMPYSKFSHMIYRGLALVWAHQTGRVEPKPKL